MSAAASHLLVSLGRACAAGVSMLNPALESLCSSALAIILRWMFSRNICSGSLMMMIFNYLYTAKHHAHRDMLVQICAASCQAATSTSCSSSIQAGPAGQLPRAV